MKKALWIATWAALTLPAIYQVALVTAAIAGRVAYPYDLEWMEGGMLHHALRLQGGLGVYVPPSIDFIPYLYTPLYPAVIALVGHLFGISYVVGRMISVLSLVGIAVVAVVSIGRAWPVVEDSQGSRPGAGSRIGQPAQWGGALLALGLFAAAYPYLDGWYDLARADTLFLFAVTAAIAALPSFATTGTGIAGHVRVAMGAAILVLAFFCKQTGIFYVGLGGAVIAVCNWRRVGTFVAVAGVLGLGTCALMNAVTDGWFWIYVSKIHRAHDFSIDRFWRSFGNILWRFPALSIVVAVGLVAVATTAVTRKPLPSGTRTFVLWAATFAVSIVVGAVGWGTEFAHFNAYMPAFLHGAFAAGSAIAVVGGCAKIWFANDRLAQAAAALTAVALAVTCAHNRWDPQRWMPTPRDVAAGDRLIWRIATEPGELWMPSHPWYLVLAGKSPFVHRMGIKDVTTRQTRTVAGLNEALAAHRFSAIVMDNRDLFLELPMLPTHYRQAHKLAHNERPRLYSGARIVPDSVWVPLPSTDERRQQQHGSP